MAGVWGLRKPKYDEVHHISWWRCGIARRAPRGAPGPAPAGGPDLPIEDIPEVLTQGGDWDDVLHEIEAITSERIVVNLGPVHPATHGVLRLILELDGEKVRETRIDIELSAGPAQATVWTNDLTHGYVTINADYTT